MIQSYFCRGKQSQKRKRSTGRKQNLTSATGLPVCWQGDLPSGSRLSAFRPPPLQTQPCRGVCLTLRFKSPLLPSTKQKTGFPAGLPVYGQGDLNPHSFEYEPKSYVSASSTIPAVLTQARIPQKPPVFNYTDFCRFRYCAII